MRLLPILALLCLVTPAFAGETHAPGTCYQKTITVCVPKKAKKKPAPVVVAPPAPAPEPPPVVIQVNPTRTVVVTKTVKQDVPCNKKHVKDCRKEPKVVVGGFAQLGVGVRDQYVQGNIGLQLEFPKARLGLRIFSALDKGVGAQALIYPYRGDRVKLHIIDPGVVVTGAPFNDTNNTDVPRRVDLIFGAGVQVKLACHLDLTVDWRVNVADPGMLARENGKLYATGPNTWKYLDAPHVTGNSFSSSQLLLGLLVHL